MTLQEKIAIAAAAGDTAEVLRLTAELQAAELLKQPRSGQYARYCQHRARQLLDVFGVDNCTVGVSHANQAYARFDGVLTEIIFGEARLIAHVRDGGVEYRQVIAIPSIVLGWYYTGRSFNRTNPTDVLNLIVCHEVAHAIVAYEVGFVNEAHGAEFALIYFRVLEKARNMGWFNK